MRIYLIDGDICFDTDDMSEARLLDRYIDSSQAEAADRAAGTIAGWIDALESVPTQQATGSRGDLATRIRRGEWRDHD